MQYPNIEEFHAQQEILMHTGPLVTLADRTDTLFRRATVAVADHARPGPATTVGLILLGRLANDLRVCGVASSIGYGLQALGLAASLMEILGALAFVGDSDERAIEWAKHRDRRRSYPPKVADGIDAVLAALDMHSSAARDDWRRAYEFMCMAKHANPSLSMLQGLHRCSSGLAHVFGPDTTRLGIFLSLSRI